MNNRYIDPSTKRKNDIVKSSLQYYKNTPLFSILEFNIFGACNRSCSFCPVSNPEIYTSKHEGISIELFEKIALELNEIGYKGKILFSALSEPLLHKKIETLIKIAKDSLPEARVEIVTNGDLLTAKKLKSLYNAGLDTASVSMYDGAHQIEHFGTMIKDAQIPQDMVVLRRRYYEDGNYGMTISNRSGLIDSDSYRDANEEGIQELPLKEQCYYPFYMILVDYNGDVLLCPHDWKKSIKFGNLNQESLFDIWDGKVLKTIRHRLAKKDRNFSPCKECDVLGTVIGKESFEAWATI
jgi:radical SAM protein with 4Fe4S-binding SPASM domain